MKNWIKVGTLVASLVAGVVLADTVFDSSRTLMGTSITYTNQAMNPQVPVGVEVNGSVMGTVTVSRVRSGVTNVLLAVDATGGTSVYINKGELDGLWLLQNDLLLIRQSGTNSLNLILGLESFR